MKSYETTTGEVNRRQLLRLKRDFKKIDFTERINGINGFCNMTTENHIQHLEQEGWKVPFYQPH